jgi:predicted permease
MARGTRITWVGKLELLSEQLHQDVAYGIRALWRSPGFSITAIGVLALGIGATLAVLHLFNAAVFHRLSIRDAEYLMHFEPSLPYPVVAYYRDHDTSFSYLVAERHDGIFVDDELKAELTTFVTGNYFTDLGVNPAQGRVLVESDAQIASQPVAVLSYRFWQRQFGGDTAIVGRVIHLNGSPVQVIGIAPTDFNGLSSSRPSLFLPITAHRYLFAGSKLVESFSSRGTLMYAKLKPGLSLHAAEAELSSLTADLRSRYPDQIQPRESPRGRRWGLPSEALVVLTLVTLLVSLVLFAACANLGNILLARGQAREGEIRTRLALGAGAGRIVRQLMVENVLLAILGCAAAFVVGYFTAKALLLAGDAPPEMRVVTDWRILAAGAVLAVVSAVMFGLAPAMQASRQIAGRARGRQILLGIQVAVSCFLLIITAWLVRSTQRSLAIDVRFDYQHMLIIDPQLNAHNLAGAAARLRLDEIADRIQQHPGVAGFALSDSPTFSDRPPVSGNGLPPMDYRSVSISYFSLMNLPLRRGRLFSDGEEDVVVLSESAARAIWPNEDPIGKKIATTPLTWSRGTAGRRTMELLIDKARTQVQRTVVGIVADSGLNRTTRVPEAYTPFNDENIGVAALIVRTNADPVETIKELRSAASSPSLMPEARLMRTDVEQRMGTPPGVLAGIGSLGASATLLAGFGIFGLIAFTVAQRTREIGVRMALGAGPAHIVGSLMSRYAAGMSIGAAAGVALAVIVGLLIGSRFVGLDTQDPISYLTAVILLALIALIAVLIPASRALRIDPSSALRWE